MSDSAHQEHKGRLVCSGRHWEQDRPVSAIWANSVLREAGNPELG